MPTEITMPKLSDTMTEGKLIAWKKSPGARVERGEIVAEVETDKANMELEAFASGILLETRAKEGDVVQVGQVIAIIGQEGEQPASSAKPEPAKQPEAVSATEPTAAKPEPVAEEGTAEGRPEETSLRKDEGLEALGEGVTAAAKPEPADDTAPQSPQQPEKVAQPPAKPQPPVGSKGESFHSSPMVRRLARERGIDLRQVAGSGPDGRILADDLDAFSGKPEQPRAGAAERKPGTEELSRMRRAIARRVAATWQQVPHFSVTAEVDMAGAEAAYRDLKGAGKRLTLNDVIVKACAVALLRHPVVNASLTGDSITIHDGVHVGVAVAVEDGLLIPVIRDCHRLSLMEIATRSAELVAKCRSGKVSEAELSGGTFTVSNLGMYGTDEFAAIINAPEAAILAVGAVADRPVIRNGIVTAGRTMRMTLSCDHRVLDGATAAEFLADLKHVLESPALILAP